MRWGEPEPDFRRDRDRFCCLCVDRANKGPFDLTCTDSPTDGSENSRGSRGKGFVTEEGQSSAREQQCTVLFQLALAAKISTSEESLRPGL